MRDPPLVFVAELVRTVNATHPKHRRLHAISPGVIQNVLARGAFRASIWAVKVQPARFGEAMRARLCIDWSVTIALALERHVAQITINLVRTGEDQRGRNVRGTNGFEQIQCSTGVDFEIADRVIKAGGDRDLRGEVEYLGHQTDDLLEARRVANVALLKFHEIAMRLMQPCPIVFHALPREIIVQHYAPTLREKPMRQIGPNKTCSTGNQDRIFVLRHTVKPRAESSAPAWSTRSTACWPSSHCTNSSNPSSNCTCGS